MTAEHPITPPPELVRRWAVYRTGHESPGQLWHNVATQAARWGWEQRGAANEAELQKARDEELEACCEWLNFHSAAAYASDLRTARRPKRSKLKQQALEALNKIENNKATYLDSSIVRRALEQLND